MLRLKDHGELPSNAELDRMMREHNAEPAKGGVEEPPPKRRRRGTSTAAASGGCFLVVCVLRVVAFMAQVKKNHIYICAIYL